MTRAQTVYLHLCVLLTAATGVVFAWMKYFMTSSDEFAVANHPLQPHMLSAHVVVAPLLVFGLGWIFSDHIWPKFRGNGSPNRRSGLWSMVMIVPMTLSAYLMQISTNESLHEAMKWLHIVSSGLFTVAYVVHLIAKPRSAQRRDPLDQPLQPS